VKTVGLPSILLDRSGKNKVYIMYYCLPLLYLYRYIDERGTKINVCYS